ncbi:hypothetical protein E2I00_018360 [Balaenoptera physalus]|uniref:Pan3 C-terminal knob domain-containing protein n=1 Tax=Balaenoptera physalus TaxID=9770 RepID=A0A6A1QHJ2_BALPH|nr:hypothetical protein E2I00_018360 [Balaenoptera physalus]
MFKKEASLMFVHYTCQRQLDAGVPEKISLISRDEKSVLVVTYSDLKRCFENTFQELIAAANVLFFEPQLYYGTLHWIQIQRHCSEDELNTAVVWHQELSEVLQPESGGKTICCAFAVTA